MLCFQSVLYCIVLYNDVFTFLYVAVGNKLLLLLLLLHILQLNIVPQISGVQCINSVRLFSMLREMFLPLRLFQCNTELIDKR